MITKKTEPEPIKKYPIKVYEEAEYICGRMLAGKLLSELKSVKEAILEEYPDASVTFTRPAPEYEHTDMYAYVSRMRVRNAERTAPVASFKKLMPKTRFAKDNDGMSLTSVCSMDKTDFVCELTLTSDISLEDISNEHE